MQVHAAALSLLAGIVDDRKQAEVTSHSLLLTGADEVVPGDSLGLRRKWSLASLRTSCPGAPAATPYFSMAIIKACPIIRASQEFKLRMHSSIPPTNSLSAEVRAAQQVCMRARRVLKAQAMHRNRMPG